MQNKEMYNVLKKARTQDGSTLKAINALLAHIIANLPPEYQKTADRCAFIPLLSDCGWSDETPPKDYVIIINTVLCNGMFEVVKTICHELYHCHNGHCDGKVATVQQDLDAENFAIAQKNNFIAYCDDLRKVK
jgi:hypothetical protein